jgi:hypothetical protein
MRYSLMWYNNAKVFHGPSISFASTKILIISVKTLFISLNLKNVYFWVSDIDENFVQSSYMSS